MMTTEFRGGVCVESMRQQDAVFGDSVSSFVASGFSVPFLGLGFRVQDRGFRVSV